MKLQLFSSPTGVFVTCDRDDPLPWMRVGYIANAGYSKMKGVPVAANLSQYAGTTPFLFIADDSARLLLSIPGIEEKNGVYDISTLDELKTIAEYLYNGEYSPRACELFFESAQYVNADFATGVDSSNVFAYACTAPTAMCEILREVEQTTGIKQLRALLDTGVKPTGVTKSDAIKIANAFLEMGDRQSRLLAYIVTRGLNTVLLDKVDKIEDKTLDAYLKGMA